jgi:tRNA dimethylallyltransferase
MTHPVIVIAGPTGTGKTARSVRLAQALGASILSADSRLVYQGLDIGTAKPSLAERDGVPHHLMDLCPPTDTYTVARYVAQARPLLDALLQAGPVLVVGGTGLYLQQLLMPQTVPAIPPDPAFRASLDVLDNASLHRHLAALDSRRAADIHPNNRVRVLRALEIIHHTGQPVPASQAQTSPYTVHWLGLTMADRDRHRLAIAQRVDAMLAAGWLAEVDALRQHWGEQANALHITHGYPELLTHLQGRLTLAEAREQTIIQVRQYARRQRTWFHHHAPNMAWTAVDQVDESNWLARVLGMLAPSVYTRSSN